MNSESEQRKSLQELKQQTDGMRWELQATREYLPSLNSHTNLIKADDHENEPTWEQTL